MFHLKSCTIKSHFVTSKKNSENHWEILWHKLWWRYYSIFVIYNGKISSMLLQGNDPLPCSWLAGQFDIDFDLFLPFSYCIFFIEYGVCIYEILAWTAHFGLKWLAITCGKGQTKCLNLEVLDLPPFCQIFTPKWWSMLNFRWQFSFIPPGYL